jgi:hypothetical protein
LPLFNAGAQEQRAQVLRHGARADLQFGRDFLVAAAFDQQLQDVLIAARDFDLLQINHCFPPAANGRGQCATKHLFRQTFAIKNGRTTPCEYVNLGSGFANRDLRANIKRSPFREDLCHNEIRLQRGDGDEMLPRR